jgi:hypothetical protein
MQKVDIKGKTGVTSLIHYALLEKDLFHSLYLPVLLLTPTSSLLQLIQEFQHLVWSVLTQEIHSFFKLKTIVALVFVKKSKDLK